jgi:hypothetical protein
MDFVRFAVNGRRRKKMIDTELVAKILQEATIELKEEDDKAEAKYRERDRLWREAWKKGLDEEYSMQVAFENLIQHN